MPIEIPSERVEMYGVLVPASIITEVPEQFAVIQIELLRYLTCNNIHDALSRGKYETGFSQNKPGEDGREIARLERFLLTTPHQEILRVLKDINRQRLATLHDIQRVYRACQKAGIPWSRPAYFATRRVEQEERASTFHPGDHRTLFGSWNEACRRACLPLHFPDRRKRVTKEEIFSDLEKIFVKFLKQNQHASNFTRRHYIRLGGKFYSSLTNSCGFWREFLLSKNVRRLGPPSSPKFTEAQLKQSLLQAACRAAGNLSQVPQQWPDGFHLSINTYRVFAKQCGGHSENTLIKRFGGKNRSWQNVLDYCGIQ